MDDIMKHDHNHVDGKMCEMCDMKGGKMMCGCMCHKSLPVLVILFAALFFLKAINVVSYQLADIAWPILVGLGGFMKLGANKCKCCG